MKIYHSPCQRGEDWQPLDWTLLPLEGFRQGRSPSNRQGVGSGARQPVSISAWRLSSVSSFFSGPSGPPPIRRLLAWNDPLSGLGKDGNEKAPAGWMIAPTLSTLTTLANSETETTMGFISSTTLAVGHWPPRLPSGTSGGDDILDSCGMPSSPAVDGCAQPPWTFKLEQDLGPAGACTVRPRPSMTASPYREVPVPSSSSGAGLVVMACVFRFRAPDPASQAETWGTRSESLLPLLIKIGISFERALACHLPRQIYRSRRCGMRL